MKWIFILLDRPTRSKQKHHFLDSGSAQVLPLCWRLGRARWHHQWRQYFAFQTAMLYLGRCIYVPFENNQLDQIMDLEKACIIHRNSSFGRGRFWPEIWHVGAFWCAQSRFAEGLSFEGEEEGGWLAYLWLCVQIIWGLWKGCGLWSRKELDTMDGWWIPTYRQVCSIIFWLNVIKAVLKSSFVDVIIVVVNGGFLRDLFQKYLTWICPLHSSKGDWSFIYFHGT